MKHYQQKFSLILLCWGFITSVFAHTYFFSITELTLNKATDKIEIIHQITTHDLETAIAEINQISFSPEHKNYEGYIQNYVEEHFNLMHLNNKLEIRWLGIEIKQGSTFIYQEVAFDSFLSGLLVKNQLLVNTYPKQTNIVNFQDSRIKGSLTFNSKKNIAKIE